MKLKYFILFLIIIASAVYFYQNKHLQNTFMGKVHQLAPELNKSTLYKWQNNKGEWQVTDKPPKKGISFTTINTQDQVNIIPSPITKKKN